MQLITPCTQQHFHQLHKSSRFHQRHGAGSQTEMPNNEHASLFWPVTEQKAAVSSECWDWAQMSQAVNQNVTSETTSLILETTCEMVSLSLMFHQLTACFLAFLLIQHISSLSITVYNKCLQHIDISFYSVTAACK